MPEALIGAFALFALVTAPLWLAGATGVAWAASEVGRPGSRWFLVALLLSPPFALGLLIAVGGKKERKSEERS